MCKRLMGKSGLHYCTIQVLLFYFMFKIYFLSPFSLLQKVRRKKKIK